MATNSYVPIFLPEASDLADLRGISVDLESARSYAAKLLAFFADYRTHSEFVEALTIAALVSYSRPFVTGVRKPLRDDALAVLSPEQRNRHDHLKGIRDKHIAHSVNTFEENQPIARFWVERVKEEGITSIDCQHSRIVSLGYADVAGLISLADTLLAHVDARIEEEKAKLLPLVRALPLDEILAGSDRGRGAVGEGAVEKRRPRLDGK